VHFAPGDPRLRNADEPQRSFLRLPRIALARIQALELTNFLSLTAVSFRGLQMLRIAEDVGYWRNNPYSKNLRDWSAAVDDQVPNHRSWNRLMDAL